MQAQKRMRFSQLLQVLQQIGGDVVAAWPHQHQQSQS